MNEVVFIKTWPRHPTTAAEVEIRLAGGGQSTPYLLAGAHYRSGVIERPRFSASMAFNETGWTGAIIPTTGVAGFAPSDPAHLDSLLALVWRRARIEVWVGPEGSSPALALSGMVADMAYSQGRLELTIADLSARYDQPLLGAPFTGTGGAEGHSSAAGRAKRRSWGVVRNVEGRLLDPANSIYEFGDPTFPLQAITVLRDKGRAGSTSVVGWQGSVAATLAALVASSPATGGGVVAPSIACAKWWTQPAGPLTADIEGEVGAGYVQTAPAIASRLIVLAGGSAIANLAAANGWRPGAAGIHVDEASETWAGAVDRVTLGASLLWRIEPNGSSRLIELGWGASAETIAALFEACVASLPPTKERTLIYRRNHRQHSDGEISAAVLVGDIDGLSDWATVDDPDVTPAKLAAIEDGADVTANAQVTPAPPAGVTIYCDSLGAPKTGQLPKVLTPAILRAGADIRTAAVVSHAITATGVLDASINNSAGDLNKGRITIGAGWSGPGTIRWTPTVDGVDYGPFDIAVARQNDPPPSSGGGGGGVKMRTDATLSPINSTSFAAISDEMQVDVASGETITLVAPLDYSVAAAGNIAARAIVARAEYRPASGGSWASFTGSNVTGSDASWDAGDFSGEPGSIAVNQSKSSLSADSYLVRLVAALSSSTGSPTISVVSGTVIVSVA